MKLWSPILIANSTNYYTACNSVWSSNNTQSEEHKYTSAVNWWQQDRTMNAECEWVYGGMGGRGGGWKWWWCSTLQWMHTSVRLAPGHTHTGIMCILNSTCMHLSTCMSTYAHCMWTPVSMHAPLHAQTYKCTDSPDSHHTCVYNCPHTHPNILQKLHVRCVQLLTLCVPVPMFWNKKDQFALKLVKSSIHGK